MQRINATPPGPAPRGWRAEIEMNHPRTSVDHREPTLTFDPDEAALSKPTGRLTSPARDRIVLSANLHHQRQQSAPTFPPLDVNTQSRSPSTTHTQHQSQGMPLTGDGRSGQRPENSPKRFASWLGGTSATPVEGAASPDTTPKSKRGASPLDTTPKSATQSRFGFLASSMSAFTTRLTNQPPTPRQVDDELCNMDIEAALFPSSSPSDHDSFSPAAYMNLQMNAAGLLHKMQDAYRERTVAMQEVQAEREAQREETEETELRIRHCKNQLEQMAAKAVEQEHAMQQLMAELQAEKRARHEEQRMSRDSRIMGEGSTITEDLGVDEEERKRWRTSDGTVMSELSIDTDRESAESESIFSRSRSPTAMTSATDSEGLDSSPAGPQQPRAPMLQVPRSKSTQRMTAFQKLVKNISGEAGDNMGSDGCRNCRGQDSSVAWDTVSLLRDENRGLKQRVAQLEITVDGALDVVNGIGLL